MSRTKIVLVSAVLVIGASVAEAQPQYAAYPYAAVPAPLPPSWSYDPYTSGLAPCPQRLNGDMMRCSEEMPPSYGQPNYWSTR